MSVGGDCPVKNGKKPVGLRDNAARRVDDGDKMFELIEGRGENGLDFDDQGGIAADLDRSLGFYGDPLRIVQAESLVAQVQASSGRIDKTEFLR